jgi:hypothetical protein
VAAGEWRETEAGGETRVLGLVEVWVLDLVKIDNLLCALGEHSAILLVLLQNCNN